MKTGILEDLNSNKMLTGPNAAAHPHPVLTVVAVEAAGQALVVGGVTVVVAGPVLAAEAVVA